MTLVETFNAFHDSFGIFAWIIVIGGIMIISWAIVEFIIYIISLAIEKIKS